MKTYTSKKTFIWSLCFIFGILTLSCSSPAENYIQKGDALFKEKKYKEAINEYTNAIKIDSNLTEAFAKRSKTKEETLDLWGSMEDHFYAGLTDTTNSEQILFRAGMYSDQGKFELAYKDYSKVISLNPNEVKALLSRGVINFNSKNYIEAELDFSSALKRAVSNIGEIYFRRGKTRLKLKNTSGAISDLSLAIYHSPENLNSYLIRALAFSKIKNHQKAIKDLNHFLSKRPTNIKALLNKALTYEELNKNVEAISTYHKITAIDPNNKLALISLASIYHDEKNYMKSIINYMKLIKIEGESADRLYNIAFNYKLLGDEENKCKYLFDCSKIDDECLVLFNDECKKK